MGFTAGIYIRHKMEGLSNDDVDMMVSTINYQNSEWTKEHYTFEEYMSSLVREDGIPEGGFNKWKSDHQEQIDWYFNHQYQDEYDANELKPYKEVETWCSGGAKFHDTFGRFGKKMLGDDWELSKDAVLKLLEYFLDIAFSFERYSISKAFTLKYNDDDDTEEIRSFSCDGMEIEDDCGRIRRLHSEYDSVVAFNGYDYDDIAMARIISLSLLKALNEAKDLDEQIFYSGGW